MNLIGLTPELEADAAKRCPGGFRAWISEVKTAEWEDADQMMKSFPRCWQMSVDTYHFSLGPDDVGIRADVFFDGNLRLVMAHRIAPRSKKPEIPVGLSHAPPLRPMKRKTSPTP